MDREQAVLPAHLLEAAVPVVRPDRLTAVKVRVALRARLAVAAQQPVTQAGTLALSRPTIVSMVHLLFLLQQSAATMPVQQVAQRVTEARLLAHPAPALWVMELVQRVVL